MKVTAEAVARLAGVSRTTVSLVLNDNRSISISEPTRKRVIEAAKRLEYGPFATHLLPNTHEYVAVMLPTLLNPFYPEALSCINTVLASFGYRTLLGCFEKNAEKERAFLEKLDVRTTKMILYVYTPQCRSVLRSVGKQIPVCVLGELDFALDCFHVALDSERAGYLAAEHLWQSGRKKLCFVSGGVRDFSFSRQKRLEGVSRFMEEHNASANLLVRVEEKERDEYRIGYAQTKKSLTENADIDAIIGVNDLTAIGALSAARDLGYAVPEQLAVMGFDNSMLARHYTPSLTSVDHHIEELAKLAVSTLLADKRALRSRKVIYEPTLMVRESTGGKE